MTPADLSRIGAALYGVRQWRAQFAADIGVTPQTVNRWLRGECGMPDTERIIAVCKARLADVRRATVAATS